MCAQAVQELLHGVSLEPLKVIPTEGGPVLHMLRCDSPLFKGFGEVYFSELLPGAVKAWKRHTLQTQHLSVPVGKALFVLYDARQDSPTFGRHQEIYLGRPDHYQLLVIPPLIWYGFACAGDTTALVANCADLPHSPNESERIAIDDSGIPYKW